MFLDLNLPLDDEHAAAGGAARAVDFEHVDRRVAMAQQRTASMEPKRNAEVERGAAHWLY